MIGAHCWDTKAFSLAQGDNSRSCCRLHSTRNSPRGTSQPSDTFLTHSRTLTPHRASLTFLLSFREALRMPPMLSSPILNNKTKIFGAGHYWTPTHRFAFQVDSVVPMSNSLMSLSLSGMVSKGVTTWESIAIPLCTAAQECFTCTTLTQTNSRVTCAARDSMQFHQWKDHAMHAQRIVSHELDPLSAQNVRMEPMLQVMPCSATHHFQSI
mmetsp:Transcript_8588/g.31773  ORF Transcript_8588/g.31773 Transcript_8588/m.31773 type:complete len:211 (-) Transcript_8588:4712-5344(-)